MPMRNWILDTGNLILFDFRHFRPARPAARDEAGGHY